MSEPRGFMQAQADPMGNPMGGDWLDGALRASREPVDDDGFTMRVMDALPAAAVALQPSRVPAWRRPVVSLLWVLALIGAAVSLPGVLQDVARSGYRLATAYPVSVGELVVAVAAAALVVWTATALALRRQFAALG